MEHILSYNEPSLLVLVEVTLATLFFQFVYCLQRPRDQRRRQFLVLLACFLLYELLALSVEPGSVLYFQWMQSIRHCIGHVATVALLSSIVWYHHRASDIVLPARYRIFTLSAAFIVSLMMTARVDNWLCRSGLGVLSGAMIAYLYYAIRIFYGHKQLQLFGRHGQSGRIRHGVVVGLAFFSLLPVATLVHLPPLAETIMAGTGMVLIVGFYIRVAIIEAQSEYTRLQTASRSMEDILKDNCKHYQLTPREAQVAERLVTGLPYKVVAAELEISEKTVSRHVGNIFAKVGVTNKTELVHHLRQTINV